jgi:hypothetical protein
MVSEILSRGWEQSKVQAEARETLRQPERRWEWSIGCGKYMMGNASSAPVRSAFQIWDIRQFDFRSFGTHLFCSSVSIVPPPKNPPVIS